MYKYILWDLSNQTSGRRSPSKWNHGGLSNPIPNEVHPGLHGQLGGPIEWIIPTLWIFRMQFTHIFPSLKKKSQWIKSDIILYHVWTPNMGLKGSTSMIFQTKLPIRSIRGPGHRNPSVQTSHLRPPWPNPRSARTWTLVVHVKSKAPDPPDAKMCICSVLTLHLLIYPHIRAIPKPIS